MRNMGRLVKIIRAEVRLEVFWWAKFRKHKAMDRGYLDWGRLFTLAEAKAHNDYLFFTRSLVVFA